MNPTVSVIIPTYNRSDVLRYSVESVLNQTYPVMEVIIVDDGSTDDTGAVVEKAMRDKPRWREHVRYFYQSNKGQSAANNHGVSKARGEWLGLNANDDMWSPWKLEWQMRTLAKYGDCGVCFTDAWFMNNPFMKSTLFQQARVPDRPVFGIVDDAPRRIAGGQHAIWMQTVIAKASLVKQVGGVDEELRYSEDHEFLFRLALATKFCFVSMPMVLIDRSPAKERHTGESRNWHKEEFCLRMDQKRFEKQLNLCPDSASETVALLRRNLSNLHSHWANWYLEQGKIEQAVDSLHAASKYALTPKLALKRIAIRLMPAVMRRLVIRDRKKAVRYDRVSWSGGEVPPALELHQPDYAVVECE